jgi:hypothetical protein
MFEANASICAGDQDCLHVGEPVEPSDGILLSVAGDRYR